MSSTEAVVIERKRREWYIKLIQDLKEMLRKQEINLIKFKHMIGERINAEKENVPYGEIFAFIKELARDLQASWQDLYFCTKFAEKHPDLEAFLKEATFLTPLENLSWRYITQNLLYEKGLKETVGLEEKPEKPEEAKRCPMEQALFDLFMALNPLKDETLNCEACGVRPWCIESTPKVDVIGKRLQQTQA